MTNHHLVPEELEKIGWDSDGVSNDKAIMARDLPLGSAVSEMKAELQKIGAEVFGT
ncbi:hypothetical protein V2K62_25265 [Pseudomonas alliivorans]|nr:hypothetical protein [Pseudomonas alliivorans]MEE4836241.1 hypothetical protein [Pseudomonas alliivorans]MEE4927943.1 hypothetical protein [Pseudomonas alliivorans]